MSHRASPHGSAAAILAAALTVSCGTHAPPTNSAAPAGVDVSEVTGTTGRAEELLIGRFPGVQVLRLPNGSLAVRVRGSSTIMGDNEPLYVVDGHVLDNTPGGALTGIDPNDIERIEVLKDIGSTSFYGVRGANGVIVITTKTGKKKK